MVSPSALIPVARIARAIYLIRGHRVMLDADLARIYGVTTKRLNQQVNRNRDRFPADFMFQLTPEEDRALRLRIATSNTGRGGRRYLPLAFTEHGAIMLAAVLNTPVAVQASLRVVRAFVRLREMLSAHKELAVKLDELERKLSSHDGQIQTLFDAIRELMVQPEPPPKPIGFHVKDRETRYAASTRSAAKGAARAR